MRDLLAELMVAVAAWLAFIAGPPAEPVPEQTDTGWWSPASDARAADEPDAHVLHPYWSLSRERIAQFDRLAGCESNHTWDINTGNGYYGGIQFSLRSWEWVGGEGWPHEASREEQIWRGELLRRVQGWSGGWPGCTRKFGGRP